MKKGKAISLVLAITLFFSMIVPSMAFAVAPPANLPQNAIASTFTDPFATGMVFASDYGQDGSASIGAFLAGAGVNGTGCWSMTGNTSSGGKNLRMNKSGYNNIQGIRTITFDLKSTRSLTIQLKKAYTNAAGWAAVPAGYGTKTSNFSPSSKKLTIASTGGEWRKITIPATDFMYGISTSTNNNMIDSDVTNFVDAATADRYSTIGLGVGSASSSSDYAYVDNFTFHCGPSNSFLTRKTVSMGNPGERMTSYGQWSGFTTSFVAGSAENGISDALRFKIISTGSSGAYLVCNNQLANLTGVDVLKLRMKSDFAFTLKFEKRVNDVTNSTSGGYTVITTNNEWMDVCIPFSSFYNVASAEWINNIEPASGISYLMKVEANSTSSVEKNIYIDNIELIKYNPLASFSTLQFRNGGEDSDSGLKAGTTDVVATFTNKTPKAITGSTLVAGMYDITTQKLIAVKSEPVNLALGQTSAEITIPLTIPDGGDPSNYQIKVFLWNDILSATPATGILTFGSNGVVQ